MAVTAEVDPRPGGTIRWTHANGDACVGQLRRARARPPHRVHLRMGTARRRACHPGSTTVEISLERPARGHRPAARTPRPRRPDGRRPCRRLGQLPSPPRQQPPKGATRARTRSPHERVPTAAELGLDDDRHRRSSEEPVLGPGRTAPGPSRTSTRSTMMGLPVPARPRRVLRQLGPPHRRPARQAARAAGRRARRRAAVPQAFAPAGRRFREWAAIPARARGRTWPRLLAEALELRRGAGLMSAAAQFAFPADTSSSSPTSAGTTTRPGSTRNRARYEAAYLEPAKAFVEAVGPGLDGIVPGHHRRAPGARARSSGSTATPASAPTSARTRTTSTSGSGRADRKAAVSGLFLRIVARRRRRRRRRPRFRPRPAGPLPRRRGRRHPRGASSPRSSTTWDAPGVEVGGETYVRTPRGVAVDNPASERLLRHSALYAHAELPAAAAATAGFLGEALRLWRTSRAHPPMAPHPRPAAGLMPGQRCRRV